MTHTKANDMASSSPDGKVAEVELDEIMEDLIVGHNFEYARKALLEWREATTHKERDAHIRRVTLEARRDEIQSSPVWKDLSHGYFEAPKWAIKRVAEIKKELQEMEGDR